MLRTGRYKWSIAVCAAALLFTVPVLSGCGDGKDVKTKDLDALIQCSGFPVTLSSVKTNGGVIEGVEEFGEVDPDTIFTEPFVKSITSFDLKRIVKGEDGFVVGDEKNSIVFDEKNGKFVITAINVK